MTVGQEAAKQYLSYGFNPVPVDEEKNPIREEWNTIKMTDEEIEDFSFTNIGICTGVISGGLEALDFDLKNAVDPKRIMSLFKSRVPKSLLEKLVVQTTPSGGYHMIYRCEDIGSSRKLTKNEEGLAIIETRGEGGYIKCYPSDGYSIIQGSLDNIPIITPEERLQLFISAKMISATLVKEAKKRIRTDDKYYLRKFPDYNDDIEIGTSLLEEHGWKRISETDINDEWINYTRPNKDFGVSGGYHKEGKFFYCFSSSQDTFETEKPYNNHALYAELECDGRYNVAYAKLYEQGYGNITDEEIKSTLEEIESQDWEKKLENLTFLSDNIEENGYLEQARKGEIQQGLSTGWEGLDSHFRFKEHSFNMGLGFDGVGKSLLMLSLAVSSNVLHDWKWGMVMPENKTSMSRRRLVEASSGKYITQFKDYPELFEQQLKESRDNFKIISNKKHYSIKDVIEMGKRLYEVYGIKALLIDPYNFFKVTGNGYAYNNEILSELRVFSEQYCSVYVMAHPRSDSPRTSKDVQGYLKAPSRYDIQGGADFPYRVDDFFILHRLVNHPDKDIRKTMQFIVEKIKEEETGGKRHNLGEWSELVWENRNGFIGYWDVYGNNPMYKVMANKLNIQQQLKTISPEEAFGV